MQNQRGVQQQSAWQGSRLGDMRGAVWTAPYCMGHRKRARNRLPTSTQGAVQSKTLGRVMHGGLAYCSFIILFLRWPHCSGLAATCFSCWWLSRRQRAGAAWLVADTGAPVTDGAAAWLVGGRGDTVQAVGGRRVDWVAVQLMGTADAGGGRAAAGSLVTLLGRGLHCVGAEQAGEGGLWCGGCWRWRGRGLGTGRLAGGLGRGLPGWGRLLASAAACAAGGLFPGWWGRWAGRAEPGCWVG